MFKKLFGSRTATTQEVFGTPMVNPYATPIETAKPEVDSQVSLLKKIDAAKISLSKAPKVRKMAVRAYIDASGSMSSFYRNGVVQELSERALGFVLAMDDDGEVPTYTFSYKNVLRAVVTIDNYRGIVASRNFFDGGSTNLSDALADLEKVAKVTTEPIYALIVTDGAPDNRADVAARIKRLANYKVFIKILVVGNSVSAWNYIVGLDDMTEGRLLDNVDAQKINNPSQLTDQQFADMMVEELDDWFVLAENAGLL